MADRMPIEEARDVQPPPVFLRKNRKLKEGYYEVTLSVPNHPRDEEVTVVCKGGLVPWGWVKEHHAWMWDREYI